MILLQQTYLLCNSVLFFFLFIYTCTSNNWLCLLQQSSHPPMIANKKIEPISDMLLFTPFSFLYEKQLSKHSVLSLMYCEWFFQSCFFSDRIPDPYFYYYFKDRFLIVSILCRVLLEYSLQQYGLSLLCLLILYLLFLHISCYISQ